MSYYHYSLSIFCIAVSSESNWTETIIFCPWLILYTHFIFYTHSGPDVSHRTLNYQVSGVWDYNLYCVILLLRYTSLHPRSEFRCTFIPVLWYLYVVRVIHAGHGINTRLSEQGLSFNIKPVYLPTDSGRKRVC